MRNSRVIIIPFRFPGYPEKLVSDQIGAAEKAVSELSIEMICTDHIVSWEDADKLTKELPSFEADFVILLVPTWIEPPLVVRTAKPLFGKPIILWGFTTFQNKGWRVHMGGMAGSGAVHGSLKEMGVPHHFVYGMPGSKKVSGKISDFANLARAKALMNKATIGMVGYVFAGMHAAGFDNASLRMRVGPEIEHIDTYSLVRKMQGIEEDSKMLKAAAETISSRLNPDTPLNSEELSRVSKMYAALKEVYEERSLDAITVKCNYELSKEFGQSACIPLSVLGDEVVSSCEADIPVVVTQLILHYLTGGKTTSYADVHDLADGKALIGACGYAPTSMCINNQITCGRPGLAAQGLGATFSGWIVNSSPMKEGEVTLARLLKQGDRYTMHFVTGRAVGDLGKVAELDCPSYPTTEIELDTDMDDFAQNMGSHHYAIVYADVAKELTAFCEMIGIDILVGKTKEV